MYKKDPFIVVSDLRKRIERKDKERARDGGGQLQLNGLTDETCPGLKTLCVHINI